MTTNFDPTYDLLQDPMFTWRRRGSSLRRGSLPELLHGLSTGDVIDFCRARPHQWHILGMFLAQLAFHAVAVSGREPPSAERWNLSTWPVEFWREILLEMSGGRREPWCLVVPDLELPAFLQTPRPFANLKGKPRPKVTPDEIDTPFTSSNVVPKPLAVAPDDEEAWMLALLALQTSTYYAAQFYSCARVGNSFATRGRVGLYPALDSAAMFRRDLVVMHHEVAIEQARVAGLGDDGVRLAWLEPMEETPAPLSRFAPHFIEAARRVRLLHAERGIVAKTLRGPRAIEECNGVVGDPWIPVKNREGSPVAFDVSYDHGLTYRAISPLLVGNEVKPPPAQTVPLQTDGGEALWLVFGLAGTKGKTRGPFERVIKIPADLQALDAPQMARLEREFVALAAKACDALRFAVAEIAKNLPGGRKVHGRADLGSLRAFKAKRTRSFQSEIDQVFFDELFVALREGTSERWRRVLEDMLAAQIRRSLEEFPLPLVEQAKRETEATRRARARFQA